MPRFLPALALMFLVSGFHSVQAETPDVKQIMLHNDATSKVVDARSELTMILSNAEGEQRIRKLVAMTKLKENGIDNMRVLRFSAPADIKGTATLLIEQTDADDMWIYLPALKKTRRLVSDNKRDSFIGSDLSFGDLIGHKPGDWISSLQKEEVLEGKSTYVIESIPKDDAIKSQTGYSKRLLWVDKESFIALKIDYWDESGEFLKSIHVSDIRKVDANSGKWQYMQLDAENRQSGHKTAMHFDDYQVNQQLTDELFTSRTLEKDQ